MDQSEKSIYREVKNEFAGASTAMSEAIAIIKSFGTDLRLPKDRIAVISSQTNLDKDLGLDSLSRVELMSRVERHFNVSIKSDLYSQIETVDQLMRAIEQAQPKRPEADFTGVPRTSLPESVDVPLPVQAKTLVEALEWHVRTHGDRIHLVIHEQDSPDTSLTYKELYEGALACANGLQNHGIAKGDAIALMLPTCRDYFFCFFGCLLAGGIPVPIYPPARPSQIEDHLQRHSAILRNSQAKVLITTSTMTKGVGRLLKLKTTELEWIACPEDIKAPASGIMPPAAADDVAFLQYTSGSTGNPKGVILTHANLLANIRAMGETLRGGPKDVFVSWLPLYHDMGLIGAWLGSLYFAARFVVMSPFVFLSRPYRWLQAIEHYGATLTAAPNFAYELCLRQIGDEEAARLNLRSLRVMCNGAEAVIPETIERFLKKFETAGLSGDAMLPVYGLAENAVGLVFPPLGRSPRIDTIDREILIRSGRAQVHVEKGHRALRFAACGQPLRDHEVRIVDDADREVAEREEGHLQFRGPSATSGYYRNPEQTKRLFHGDWLDSGDRGYTAEGDIFVTGRVKDMIKHAGRNLYPEELENALSQITGIRKGCVAAFGSTDPNLGTERLIIIAETRVTDESAKTKIRGDVNTVIASIIGAAPDEVVLAPPHSVLKTSSGKIRRSACKALFESGTIGSQESRVRWQIIHYTLGAVPIQIRKMWNNLKLVLNSVFVWIVALLTILVFWPFVVTYPSLDGRWRITRAAAWIAARLSGIRVTVAGQEYVKPDARIFVANHSSYVDALVLTLALPRVVTIVAKAELGHFKLLGWTFRRLGVEFVERFDMKQSLEDSKRITQLARNGRSLLSFPEGTFTRRAGLLPFHIGPFLTAVEAELPVAPIVIRGTRSILHPDSWIVRRGLVSINFLPAIDEHRSASAELSSWERALNLREKVRAVILAACGEADLGAERIVI